MDRAAAHATRRRVLVLLPNWLGDVVMTTPLLAHLHQAFAGLTPETRPSLHLAVRRPWSVLFEQDPRIADLLVLDRNGRHGGLAGIWRQAGALRQGRFDAVLICPPSLRAGLASALARIPIRAGYAGDGRKWLLKPGLDRLPRGHCHFSEEMLALAQPLLDAWGIVAPAPPAAASARTLLPGCTGLAVAPVRNATTRPIWAVAPGTTYGEAKTWPVARMARFIAGAVEDHGAQVVLLGDGQVAAFVAAMRRTSTQAWTEDPVGSGDVVDLTGRTDLEQVVRLLKGARVFVGNDSGLMHLAGALGVPTVGLFGSSNPAWTHPLGRHTETVVAEGFACQPCYRRTCNQAVFCLETVTAETVLQQVGDLVAAVTPVPGKGER